MIKHLLWILLLFGCHSSSDTESHLKISPISDTTETQTTVKRRNELKKEAKLFDNKQAFEITSFANAINKHTTDTDTMKCSHWRLSKSDIEKVIKNSEPIDGTTWDLSFSVFSCIKTVNVVQAGQQFKVEINAASFLSVSNGDTTVLFGDYNKVDRKYFLEQPNDK